MTGQERVSQWTTVVHSHLPHLTKPPATVRALWSLGMVLARSGALTALSLVWATWRARTEATVRQQLREFLSDKAAKRGGQRQAVGGGTCFRPLLAWVPDGGAGQHLALALDATTLGDRCVALAVRVVYRGGAIPVAWTRLAAGTPHGWRTEGLRLLRLVRVGGAADAARAEAPLADLTPALAVARRQHHATQPRLVGVGQRGGRCSWWRCSLMRPSRWGWWCPTPGRSAYPSPSPTWRRSHDTARNLPLKEGWGTAAGPDAIVRAAWGRARRGGHRRRG